MRFALHCDVDPRHLENSGLVYQRNDSWHRQDKFRETISTLEQFAGKSLPRSSEHQAWQTSLTGGFQTDSKAVTLSADLVYSSRANGPLFELILQPLKFELSHRLSRRFGADRFLEITIPSLSSSKERLPEVVREDDQRTEKVTRWLTCEAHYFLGRHWRVFFMKDVEKREKPQMTQEHTTGEKRRVLHLKRVFLFACDGNEFRIPRSPGEFPAANEARHLRMRTKLSLKGLLNWTLNINGNSNQPITKLFSRIGLCEFSFPEMFRSYLIFGSSFESNSAYSGVGTLPDQDHDI